MITRNNYEEFFLLYVDNELSAAERETVERFVRDNPDLEAELNQLKHAVLRPGNELSFGDKKSLFRDSMAVEKRPEASLLRGELPVWAGESSFIDEENYPTYLLSYIDNELDEESRKVVADYVHQHPRLEEELAILQQTRLEPDPAIVFDGKELLYKLQYSKRGIIFSWTRIAAAILLLIAGLLVFDKTTHRSWKQSQSKESALRGKEKIFKNDSQAVTLPAPHPLYNRDQKDAITRNDTGLIKSPDKNRKMSPVHRKTKTDPVVLNTSRPDKRQNPVTDNQKDTDNIAGTNGNNMVNSPDNVTTTTLPALVTNPTPVSNNTVMVGNKENTIAMVREGIPIEDPSAIKKNKMRGLFRKVTRVLERTTNADNDNNENNRHGTLIGSFQVAL